jgi:hypothetical protein
MSARLITSLDCAVTYPDGSAGCASYQRVSPTYHKVTYRSEDGIQLARLTFYEQLHPDHINLEAFLVENVGKAFEKAIETERADFFARATYPAGGHRSVDPNKATLKPDKAKRLAGRYAVCLVLPSGKLLAVSRDYETVHEANNRFLAEPRADHVVACCSRLDRRWMVPRYNPLHKAHDFRKAVARGRE